MPTHIMNTPTYSTAERDRRWNLARQFMDKEGVDAMLVFGEHEDAGPAPVSFDTWLTNGRPGTTVIFPKTADPVSLTPFSLYAMDHLESSRRGDNMWIPPQNIRTTRDSRAIVKTLNDLGLSNATIGTVGLAPCPPWQPEGIIPYQMWNNTLKLLPNTTFKSVDAAFTHLIMPQSPEELALVRHSASIGDAMARAMAATAAPGVSEAKVYAAGMAAGYERGSLPPAMHLLSGPDPVAFGIPHWAFRPQAPRTLRAGDIITAELFSQFGGRHTQHQILIAIGDVHEDYQRAARVARAMYDAGLAALRPGRKFADFVNDMKAPLDSADAQGGWVMGPAVHSLNPLVAVAGYPRGLDRLEGAEAYPPAEDMATTLGDMVLQPGMTFAFEPNYAFGRHVVHLGGTVIVGEEGAEELNPYTAKILHAEGKAVVD